MVEATERNLIPVILCGGSGMRLWPLSRKRFPKQFVSLPLHDHKNNLFFTTVERTIAFNPRHAIVVCNEAHRFFVAEDLRAFDSTDFSVLTEPVSRNTAPAIALAALRVIEQHGDGLMLVMPSDHVVADAATFQRAVQTARLAADHDYLVTFGVVPQRAETGYGYIRRGASLKLGERRMQAVFHAAEFKEKPTAECAQRWLDSGDYYWNSGMFLFKASVYLERLQACAPEVYVGSAQAYAEHRIDRDFIGVESERFARCPDISVDYAVLEKSDQVAVMPVHIGWNDIGSWDALGSLLECDGDGNVAVGDAVFKDATHNIVYADKRLVTVLGLENCIIVETSDAVLIAKREKAQDVKRLVEKLRTSDHAQVDEHPKVYRPWGSYESVDANQGFQVKRIIVNPGQSLSLQMHHQRSEHWIVVRGEVRVTRGEEQFMLGANQSTYIPVETRHRLENLGATPAHLIEVQCGSYLGEDDIVRFEDNYGRTDQS